VCLRGGKKVVDGAPPATASSYTGICGTGICGTRICGRAGDAIRKARSTAPGWNGRSGGRNAGRVNSHGGIRKQKRGGSCLTFSTFENRSLSHPSARQARHVSSAFTTIRLERSSTFGPRTGSPAPHGRTVRSVPPWSKLLRITQVEQRTLTNSHWAPFFALWNLQHCWFLPSYYSSEFSCQGAAVNFF
jgi:hypothetical protein